MKKTLFVVLITLSFFIGLNSLSALSAKLTMAGPKTVKKGDTIEVKITLKTEGINETTGFSYINGSLSFNNEYLTYISNDNAGIGLGPNDNRITKPGVFAYSVGSEKDKMNSSLWLITVKFKVNESVPYGTKLNFTTQSFITRYLTNDTVKVKDADTESGKLTITVEDPNKENQSKQNEPKKNDSKKTDTKKTTDKDNDKQNDESNNIKQETSIIDWLLESFKRIIERAFNLFQR